MSYSFHGRMRERITAEQRHLDGVRRKQNAALYAIAFGLFIAGAMIIAAAVG